MNYEVDSYVEAGRKMPSKEVQLHTLDNDYYFFKGDILAGQVTYSTDKNLAANLETISTKRAREIIEMNRKGEKPLTLLGDGAQRKDNKTKDLLEGDISRFDKSKKKRKQSGNRGGSKDRRSRNGNTPGGNGGQKAEGEAGNNRPPHPKNNEKQ